MLLYRFINYAAIFFFLLCSLFSLFGITLAEDDFWMNIIAAAVFIIVTVYLYFKMSSVLHGLYPLGKRYSGRSFVKFIFWENLLNFFLLVVSVVLFSAIIYRIFVEQLPLFD